MLKLLIIFIVWFLTGLWHGADWNFIIWGLGLFVIMMLEKFILKKHLDKHPILGHTYMILLIPLSWAVFAVSDINQLGVLLHRMLSFTMETASKGDAMRFLSNYWYLLLAGLICCTTLPYKLYEKNKFKFIENIVDFYCTTNILHPFREGNGRTQRAFISQLIRNAGYEINFSKIDTDELMIATIKSANGVTDDLYKIFKENITNIG